MKISGFSAGFFHLPLGKRLFTNLILFALWGWLFRPVYGYLGVIFTRQEFRTNQIVLLGVLVLIALQARGGRFPLSLREHPQLHLPGLGMALVGAAAFVAAERWLEIHTLSATLFGLASYGFLGLWMDPRRWRAGLPAALLLVGVLPFGEHMETFIGYPVRLSTAHLVSQGLGALGVPSLGVDTILIFENGLSQVDNPCSGVKSLWTGGLFLLAATWIEGRPLNWRWLLTALTFGALLLAANLARVFLLVSAGPVAGLDLLAEMMHVPLGVAGFVGACLAAAAMLRLVGKSAHPGVQAPGDLEFPHELPKRPRWLVPSLSALLVGFVILYVPPSRPAAAAVFEWQLPQGIAAQAWPLTSEEQSWLTDDGSLPVSAFRWRFTDAGLSGSLLFVSSDTWRAHHRPERCFTVYGLDIQDSRLHLVSPDFPIRWLTLGLPEDPRPLYSAVYWLQSRERVTDDYAVRIWDDMAPQPQTWVLVTVLFDSPVDLTRPHAQELFAALRSSVGASLTTIGQGKSFSP